PRAAPGRATRQPKVRSGFRTADPSRAAVVLSCGIKQIERTAPQRKPSVGRGPSRPALGDLAFFGDDAPIGIRLLRKRCRPERLSGTWVYRRNLSAFRF